MLKILTKTKCLFDMIPEKKICGVCGDEKLAANFQIRRKPNGYMWLRKECNGCMNKARRIKYKTNSSAILARNKKWQEQNPGYKSEYDKVYQQANTVRKSANALRSYHKRKTTDPSFVIARTVRARVFFAVKNKSTKAFGTTELLGCSIEHLIKHLESQFTDGMSWDTFGRKGWHIDHILPCDCFDLTDVEQQKKCFHFTNLQPLWWIDNLKKGSKVLYAR